MKNKKSLNIREIGMTKCVLPTTLYIGCKGVGRFTQDWSSLDFSRLVTPISKAVF